MKKTDVQNKLLYLCVFYINFFGSFNKIDYLDFYWILLHF